MATFTFFNKWKEAQLDGGLTNTPIDFDTDSIRLALVKSTYTPSASADDFWGKAGISSNEVSGTNYTANGEVLTMTVTESSGTVTVDGTDATWSQNGAGFTDARYAILYKFITSAAVSPLVGYIDFTTNKGNVSGDLTVQFAGTGIFTLA